MPSTAVLEPFLGWNRPKNFLFHWILELIKVFCMEVDINYSNNNNNNNRRKGGVFVPNQEELLPSGAFFPPPISNSLLHSGLKFPNLGPFGPHFGPVNPLLAGPFEFEMDPDLLMEKEVQRSRSLVQVINCRQTAVFFFFFTCISCFSFPFFFPFFNVLTFNFCESSPT